MAWAPLQLHCVFQPTLYEPIYLTSVAVLGTSLVFGTHVDQFTCCLLEEVGRMDSWVKQS